MLKANELRHGKVYNCKMDGDLGEQDCTFVQLAIDANSNRRFALVGAKHLLAKNPNYIRKFVGMTLDELASEEFDGDPAQITGLQVWEFSLNPSGVLEGKAYDCLLHSFTEIDLNQFNPKS